jgi:hypothetical protein
MQADWDRRQNFLAIGDAYLVGCDAPSFPPGSDFHAGETVSLLHVDYSRYDCCHIYRFQADGGIKTYWLSDNSPLDDLMKVFIKLTSSSPLPLG